MTQLILQKIFRFAFIHCEKHTFNKHKFTETIIIFLRLSRPCACLIPKILSAVLVIGRSLKEDGTYFKIKKTKQVKF